MKNNGPILRSGFPETFIVICRACHESIMDKRKCPKCGKTKRDFLYGMSNCLTPIDERDK